MLQILNFRLSLCQTCYKKDRESNIKVLEALADIMEYRDKIIENSYKEGKMKTFMLAGVSSGIGKQQYLWL